MDWDRGSVRRSAQLTSRMVVLPAPREPVITHASVGSIRSVSARTAAGPVGVWRIEALRKETIDFVLICGRCHPADWSEGIICHPTTNRTTISSGSEWTAPHEGLNRCQGADSVEVWRMHQDGFKRTREFLCTLSRARGGPSPSQQEWCMILPLS